MSLIVTCEGLIVDWYDITGEYHSQTFAHECRLDSLPEEWQRELAALSRLECDVNNGGYLQFLANGGRESYYYASRALKKIGARKMAEIIDRCQTLVDEHVDLERSPELGQQLMPNPVIDLATGQITPRHSVLPRDIIDRIYELSYEFMDYPEDITSLGTKYYGQFIEGT